MRSTKGFIYFLPTGHHTPGPLKAYSQGATGGRTMCPVARFPKRLCRKEMKYHQQSQIRKDDTLEAEGQPPPSVVLWLATYLLFKWHTQKKPLHRDYCPRGLETVTRMGSLEHSLGDGHCRLARSTRKIQEKGRGALCSQCFLRIL